VSAIAESFARVGKKKLKVLLLSYVLRQYCSPTRSELDAANTRSQFRFIGTAECPLIRGHSNAFIKELSG